MALIGRFGKPAERSNHDNPPLSDLNTRPPPTEDEVAHMRLRLLASTKRSLIHAPLLGDVSNVAADHAAPVQLMRYTLPSVVPTYTLFGLGMYMAEAVPAANGT